MIFGLPYSDSAYNELLQYGEVLTRALRPERPVEDLLVPTRICDARCAARHPEAFPRHFSPSAEVLDILDDHPTFFRWMEDQGWGDYIPQTLTQPEFPCVLKESGSHLNGQAVYVLHEAGELHELLRRLRRPYVLQRAVLGKEEYVGHSLVILGKIRVRGVRKILLQSELERKGAPRAGEEVAQDASVFSELYARLGYTGFACENFKVIDDEPVLFEINPRMGASLTFGPNRPLLAKMLRVLADTF